MTNMPNSGSDEPIGATSRDTVELGRTVPVVPPDVPVDQILSGSPAARTTTATAPATGEATSSGPMQQTVDQAQETAGQVADQAQQKMGEVVGQAKETVTAQATSQKDRAAESLEAVAQALRQAGQELQGREQGTVAQFIDTAAERVERLSGFLQGRDVQQIVGEVERYARRNPALFLGGAFALGLLGARFLKSSSRPDQDTVGGQYYAGGTGMAYRARTYAYRPSYESTQADDLEQFRVASRTGIPGYGASMSQEDAPGFRATTGAEFASGTEGQ